MSGNAELRALAEKARDADGWTWPRAALVEACTPARILSLLDAHDAMLALLIESQYLPDRNWRERRDATIAEVQS